jgi:predicted transcriptional regulator
MNLEILKKIGLSEGEVKVYGAVLNLGLVSINNIQEQVSIDRRNIYDILNKLIEKGLVAYTEENKKRKFQITSPNKLTGYVDEKKKELDNSRDLIEKEIPEMIKRFNEKKDLIRAEVYRGIEGIKAIWEDSLNYDTTYWIGSGRYVPKKYPNFFIPWNKKRIQKKVKWMNLMRYELRNEFKLMPLESAKFLPKEFSGTPTVTCMFGNKVIQFIFGEELFAFVIESKELADNYKKYHKFLWDNVAKD